MKYSTRCTGKMQQIPSLTMYKDGQTIHFDNLRDDWADSFIDSTKDFIEAIKYDRQPFLTGEEGREVLKFSLAAMQSADVNLPIQVDALDEYKKEK